MGISVIMSCKLNERGGLNLAWVEIYWHYRRMIYKVYDHTDPDQKQYTRIKTSN